MLYCYTKRVVIGFHIMCHLISQNELLTQTEIEFLKWWHSKIPIYRLTLLDLIDFLKTKIISFNLLIIKCVIFKIYYCD